MKCGYPELEIAKYHLESQECDKKVTMEESLKAARPLHPEPFDCDWPVMSICISLFCVKFWLLPESINAYSIDLKFSLKV